MPNNIPIKGEVGILYIYDADAWEPVACLTSYTFSSTRGVIESQTKCDPGVVVVSSGTLKHEITFDGEYIDTTSAGGATTRQSHDSLLTLMRANTNIEFRIDSGLEDDLQYYGDAIITSLDLTQGAGDELSTFSGTFSVIGDITTTDPNP